MRLGTDTNSATNYLLSGTKGQPVPCVGMGATELLWSDRYAYTIMYVNPKCTEIGVQRDRAIRVDSNGMSESQEYHYESQPDAEIVYYTLRKNGAWVKKGESMRGGSRMRIGQRIEYYDYSF